MNDFDALLRDLARRDLTREVMTKAEIAGVIAEHPDVVAEALDPDLIASLLCEDRDSAFIGAWVTVRLRDRSMAYIKRDLERTRDELRQEEAEDNEFEREAV